MNDSPRATESPLFLLLTSVLLGLIGYVALTLPVLLADSTGGLVMLLSDGGLFIAAATVAIGAVIAAATAGAQGKGLLFVSLLLFTLALGGFLFAWQEAHREPAPVVAPVLTADPNAPLIMTPSGQVRPKIPMSKVELIAVEEWDALADVIVREEVQRMQFEEGKRVANRNLALASVGVLAASLLVGWLSHVRALRRGLGQESG